MRDKRCSDVAVAGQQLQRGSGHAGLVQQANGLERDQWSLLGGLCHYRIAGHQRRRHLPRKDRQRKIPRRDRGEHAAAAQPQRVALPGRARHGFVSAEQITALRGVIAAKINGFADFRDRIVQRLAALALQQRDEARRVSLQQVAGSFQDLGARVG